MTVDVRHLSYVMQRYSGVASPKMFWRPKDLGGSKCLILGEQQYFLWDTASQSATG